MAENYIQAVESTEAIRVLTECADLQLQKAADYQNPNSSIKQAMHYRRGIDTIHDMIWQKLLRAQSLIESGQEPKNESLEDTYKDMINYCSFAVSFLRGKMPGQDTSLDCFNRARAPTAQTRVKYGLPGGYGLPAGPVFLTEKTHD